MLVLAPAVAKIAKCRSKEQVVVDMPIEQQRLILIRSDQRYQSTSRPRHMSPMVKEL